MVKLTWSAASLTADPDLALLRRMAGQDQDALSELYECYAPSLLAYLTGRLGDPRLAEEVLQDVMLAVWRSAPNFRGECRVRTWLLTVARSRAINAYHRQVVPEQRQVSLDESRLRDGGAAPGRYHDLQAAIRTLPEEQRETLELVFYHGLSLQEAALVLQVAEGTVKSRLHRAKANLRNQMDVESEPDERSY